MNLKHVSIGLLLVALLVTACVPSIPVTGAENSNSDAVHADQQATINALETLVAITPSATPIDTFTPIPVETDTPIPPPAPADTSTPVPIPTATPAPVLAPCNQADFVTDVTIPDGSLVYSGTTFIKTWRVRNTGSCTWTPDYRFVFVGGDALGGPAFTRLGIAVAPGKTIDISLLLGAPTSTGNYQALYKLADANGNLFGTGAGGDGAIDVFIIDGPLPNPFRVTHVNFTVNSQAVTMACPPGFTFIFSANISASGAGDVSFHWNFSDGRSTPVQTITFTSAGVQTVSAGWTLGASGKPSPNPYSGSASIYIDSPNNQSFDSQSMTLTCTP
jgi:hypothetical protein